MRSLRRASTPSWTGCSAIDDDHDIPNRIGCLRQTDPGKRKSLVWEIERKLVEDDARPIVFYGRIGTCWQPEVKGVVNMVNSIYNGSRFEDLWLDR